VKQAILDTDTLSYVLDRRFPEVTATARQYLRVFRYLSVSAATIAEVVRGFEKVRNGLEVDRFLEDAEGFEVFPIGMAEAALAGEIMGALERSGLKIGREDPFIAATAIVNTRVLVTNNVRHYQRIVDLGYPLQLGNWRQVEG
jgi:tRNA(fMet)-specific endonuclease VapC